MFGDEEKEERTEDLEGGGQEENEPTGQQSEEGSEGDEVGGNEEAGQSQSPTKDDVEQTVKNRLARERKRLAKMLGVDHIEHAAPFFQAGQAVARASGLPPEEVARRMHQQQQTGQQQARGAFQQNQQYPQQQQQQGYDPALRQELGEIKSTLAEERAEKIKSQQESEAKKAFGSMYDEHKEDIEDKAEETGLSLVDAATIVLRPKLSEQMAKQQKAKQQVQNQRRVEGSGESPAESGGEAGSKLTAAQKETARKFGVSYDAYYKQLKRRGKVD